MKPSRILYCALSSGLYWIAAIFLVLLIGCGGSPAPISQHLVDQFSSELVSDQPADVAETPSHLAWHFTENSSSIEIEEESATLGWLAANGIRDLEIRDGRLTGVSTNDFPLLHFSLAEPLEDKDLVQSIEVRLRSTAGSNLSATSEGHRDELDFDEIIAQARARGWPATTPIVAGDNFQTYTIQIPGSLSFAEVGHILIRPTDAADARFEIESLRLVSRKEQLANVPSGIGWHGLSEVYFETIVSRSPEKISFPLEIPEEPTLELHVGTIEDYPLTFRVWAEDDPQTPLLQYTVTTPHRWESVPVDLSEYADTSTTLTLGLEAESPGTLGFWGNPVLRAGGQPVPEPGPEPDVTLDTTSGTPPQGVIIFLADTLRKDHLNFYGHDRETAPVLAKTASQGVQFMNNVAQGTWTKVSVPSIMTSLYPTSHRIKEFMDRLPASAETLAEQYRNAGFATVAYSSVLFTGKATNLHQGFEELHESGSVEPERPAKTARVFVDHFLEWLEEHRNVPFFAFVHVFDPHDPYEPFRPYNTLWADPTKKKEHEENGEKVREIIEDPLRKNFLMPNRKELISAGLDPDAYINYDKDWYDGSIRGMDVEFSRLLERLKVLGLSDRVVIAFLSDHGEEFLEHGSMFHGQTVYGELTRVPLVLYGPGHLPAGLRISQTVQNLDLMPTLLELSRLPLPDSLQGQSLLPLIAAAKEQNDSGQVLERAMELGWELRPAISEKAITKEGSMSPPPHSTESFAIVLDGWKLVHNTHRSEGPEFELFEVANDPLNLKNVANEHPAKVEELRAKLEEWREFAMANQLPEADDLEQLDPEELKRLRSLGYIQ